MLPATHSAEMAKYAPLYINWHNSNVIAPNHFIFGLHILEIDGEQDMALIFSHNVPPLHNEPVIVDKLF